MNTEVEERTGIEERITDLQDQAKNAAQNLKRKAAQWQQTATDNVVSFAKDTDTYMRDNLWMALGIAAVCAFALGWVIASRD